jgi:hypothetical protein
MIPSGRYGAELFTAPIEASRPMVSNANNALAALGHRHLRGLDRGRLGLGASGIGPTLPNWALQQVGSYQR